MDHRILAIISGVSTLFGTLSLLAFFFLKYISGQNHPRSLREIVEGERLISGDQLVRVLKEFPTEDGRFEALKAILKNVELARQILNRAEGRIDAARLERHQGKALLTSFIISAYVFIALALIAFCGAIAMDANPFRRQETSPLRGVPTDEAKIYPVISPASPRAASESPSAAAVQLPTPIPSASPCFTPTLVTASAIQVGSRDHNRIEQTVTGLALVECQLMERGPLAWGSNPTVHAVIENIGCTPIAIERVWAEVRFTNAARDSLPGMTRSWPADNYVGTAHVLNPGMRIDYSEKLGDGLPGGLPLTGIMGIYIKVAGIADGWRINAAFPGVDPTPSFSVMDPATMTRNLLQNRIQPPESPDQR